MFDVAWSEMLVLLAVAVVVIGPKDLPRVLYAAGKFTRKIKTFTGDIQKSLDRIIHDEELNEITREANKAGGENLQFEIERQLAEEERRRLAMLPKERGDAGK
ncbi:MAG TPA: Sec-independent protein translocase protein TatB [Patescibacteria group bacterium]|nr:Sec-independent protein translocase protein TatB [Patescibacteria group bacterium]